MKDIFRSGLIREKIIKNAVKQIVGKLIRDRLTFAFYLCKYF